MTDIKNKPLSVIDASLDRDVAYPPTDVSIFNPYTGGIIKQEAVEALASNFYIDTGSFTDNTGVTLKDNTVFNFAIPNLIIGLRKRDSLYYKFRVFLSLSKDDFSKGKESYFDVNLFTDITGTNTNEIRGYAAQVEVNPTIAIQRLFKLYTVDEVVKVIPTIALNTYTTVSEKISAIIENLPFLQVYAQISPVQISPNIIGVSAEYHNSYREKIISACNFTLVESALELSSQPVISGNNLKFSVKIKNIKSIKVKLSLGDSAGTSATYLDTVTRVFATDKSSTYVTLTTSDNGYSTASINYPLDNLGVAELDGKKLFDQTNLIRAFNTQYSGISVNSFVSNRNQLRHLIVEFISMDTRSGIVLTNLNPYLNNNVKYVIPVVSSAGKPDIVKQRNSNFTYVSNGLATTTREGAYLKLRINSKTNIENFFGFLIVLTNTINTLNYSIILRVSEMVDTNPTDTKIKQRTYDAQVPIDTSVSYLNSITIYSISNNFALSSEYTVELPKLDLSNLISRGNLNYVDSKCLIMQGFAKISAFEGTVDLLVTYNNVPKIIGLSSVKRSFTVNSNLSFSLPVASGQSVNKWLVVTLYKSTVISCTIPANSYSSSFITTNNLGSITW